MQRFAAAREYDRQTVAKFLQRLPLPLSKTETLLRIKADRESETQAISYR